MNAEQSVLDAIAELEATDVLVDWQLSRHAQRSGYDFNVNQASCPLCLSDWHGLDNGYCPGSWATEAQKIAYREHQAVRRPTHIDIHSQQRLPLGHPPPELFVQFGEFHVLYPPPGVWR